MQLLSLRSWNIMTYKCYIVAFNSTNEWRLFHRLGKMKWKFYLLYLRIGNEYSKNIEFIEILILKEEYYDIRKYCTWNNIILINSNLLINNNNHYSWPAKYYSVPLFFWQCAFINRSEVKKWSLENIEMNKKTMFTNN